MALIVYSRQTALPEGADTSQFVMCPANVYRAWIDRVHANKTPVAVGDTYVWFYVQLLPPKWVSCLITVQPGDEYPPSKGGSV